MNDSCLCNTILDFPQEWGVQLAEILGHFSIMRPNQETIWNGSLIPGALRGPYIRTTSYQEAFFKFWVQPFFVYFSTYRKKSTVIGANVWVSIINNILSPWIWIIQLSLYELKWTFISLWNSSINKELYIYRCLCVYIFLCFYSFEEIVTTWKIMMGIIWIYNIYIYVWIIKQQFILNNS